MAAWALIESFDGGTLFSYGSYTHGEEFALHALSSSGDASAVIKLQCYGSCDRSTTISGVDDDGWHHYCVTYDGASTTWVLYFDGLQADTGSSMVLNTGSDFGFTLGVPREGAERYQQYETGYFIGSSRAFDLFGLFHVLGLC